MLLLPAQLHRQEPHRGTAARPVQSLYQTTGWTRPSRGITMVLARTAAGAAAGRRAGGAYWTACVAWAAAAAALGGRGAPGAGGGVGGGWARRWAGGGFGGGLGGSRSRRMGSRPMIQLDLPNEALLGRVGPGERRRLRVNRVAGARVPRQQRKAQQPDRDPANERRPPTSQRAGHGSRNGPAAPGFARFTRSSRK